MGEGGGDVAAGKKDSKDLQVKKKDEGTKQKNFWSIGIAGSAFAAMIGVGMAALSVKSLTEANVYMEFIDGYDKGEYLIVLAVLGFVSAMVGVYGLAVAYLSSSPAKFKQIRYLVLAFVGWGLGLVVLLLVSFWLTFSAVGSLELVFKPGFTGSLVKYQKENKIKISIDALQRGLECCGNYNHTEWLTVSWADSASKTESAVPDSCCDSATVAAKRIKCVNSAPFGETIRLTVYKKGCVKAIVAYYGLILKMEGAMMIGIAIIEGAVAVIVVLEVQRNGKADKEEAEKSETNKLLAKTTVAAPAVAAETGKKDSDTHADAEAPATPAAPAPAAPWAYPAGYGAVPGAAPYGYYGAQ